MRHEQPCKLGRDAVAQSQTVVLPRNILRGNTARCARERVDGIEAHFVLFRHLLIVEIAQLPIITVAVIGLSRDRAAVRIHRILLRTLRHIVIELHHVLLLLARMKVFHFLRKNIAEGNACTWHFLRVIVAAPHRVAQASRQTVTLRDEMHDFDARDVLPARTEVRKARQTLGHDRITSKTALPRRYTNTKSIVNAIDRLLIA